MCEKGKSSLPHANLFNPINVILTESPPVWQEPADQERKWWRGLEEVGLGADTVPKWLNVPQISGNLPLLEFIPNKSIKGTILMNIL